MYDKELIERVCSLTCERSEVVRPQTEIKYDTEHPFKKYYSLAAIKGAIEKYLAGEWDDCMLSHWACVYCWILLGGCDYESITEDLNSVEEFLRDIITWALDGLSFFDATCEEDGWDLRASADDYEKYDRIWQTRDGWRIVYAAFKPIDDLCNSQYSLLINDTAKEYMIAYADLLENGSEDGHFRFVSREEFIAQVEQLKADGYTLIPEAEECYYEDVEEGNG